MNPRLQAMQELRASIDRSWEKVDSHNFRDIYRQASIDEARYVEILRAEHTLMHAASVGDQSRYFASIMAVGYAGYFATWFIMNEKFSPFQSAIIAFTGFLSISIFMIWEIFQMIMNIIELRKRSFLANNIIYFDDINSQLAAMAKVDDGYLRVRFWVWLITFILTVGMALVGAATMLVGISAELMPVIMPASTTPNHL